MLRDTFGMRNEQIFLAEWTIGGIRNGSRQCCWVRVEWKGLCDECDIVECPIDQRTGIV